MENQIFINNPNIDELDEIEFSSIKDSDINSDIDEVSSESEIIEESSEVVWDPFSYDNAYDNSLCLKMNKKSVLS